MPARSALSHRFIDHKLSLPNRSSQSHASHVHRNPSKQVGSAMTPLTFLFPPCVFTVFLDSIPSFKIKSLQTYSPHHSMWSNSSQQIPNSSSQFHFTCSLPLWRSYKPPKAHHRPFQCQ
uniref:Uncharacterized protein n=1 Tax=Trypanosoma congolense (strain IL3000) TaxID=1068625 RepID=G0UTT9_TRYCI|nr:hypothetical protein, unlikely [Trypanosoma congolense IL3000]